MEIQKGSIDSILSGDNLQFTIPVYQRYYNWGRKQCRQLFLDVCEVIATQKEHFFGSVVVKNDGLSKLLIDGQQRITTVSLMLLALYRLAQEGKKEAKPHLTDNIARKCFFFTDDDDECQPRIVHVEQDQKAYSVLLHNKPLEKKGLGGNIIRNYQFFYEWFLDSDYTIRDFYSGISKLQVVLIGLESSDNAQLIFESLNSTGLALSEGDKIRNFILMNLPEKKQTKCYRDYWRAIEQYANYNNDSSASLNAVTLFVRDFLTAHTPSVTSMSDIYPRFKEFAKTWGEDTEQLLERMKVFAHYLYQLEHAKTTSSIINVHLRRFALLEISVTHPFFMRVLHDFYAQKLTEDAVCSIIQVVENYIFRRFICGLSANALNNLFAALYDTASRLAAEQHTSLEQAITFLLVTKSESARFPSDDEFAQAFAVKNVYKMRPKNKIYLFFRLNAALGLKNEADTSVIEKMQEVGDHMLSVEHVMPQRLTKDWETELGEEASRIHQQWLDTIANLTLTGYNSNYSNKSFTFKREHVTEDGVNVGFAYSALPLNKFIGQQRQWTEHELNERCLLLTNCALQIWIKPQALDISRQHAREVLTLADAPEYFTYKQVIECTIEDEVIVAKPNESWKDFFVRIIKHLDESFHREILLMANDPQQRPILQNETNLFNNSVLVLPGVYAYLQSSTQTKIGIMQSLFRNLGFNLEDISFLVRSKKATSEEG